MIKLFYKEKDLSGARYYFCGVKFFERKKDDYNKTFYVFGIKLRKRVKRCLCESLNIELQQIKNVLDATVDLTQLPKACGFLRVLQLLNLEIMMEIDRVCRKHGLRYWLSFGSALGAVRHGGYIPWDDDIDICMLYSDWLKFNELAKTELKSEFCNIVLPGNIGRVCMTEFSPQNDDELMDFLFWKPQEKLLFGVDIFPVHWLRDDVDEPSACNRLMEIKYNKIQRRDSSERVVDAYRRVQEITDKEESEICGDENSKRLFASMHSLHPKPLIWYKDDIFPLREICFEGKKLFIAKEAECLLWLQFGDFWKPVMSHIHLSVNQISREEMLKLMKHARRLGIM